MITILCGITKTMSNVHSDKDKTMVPRLLIKADSQKVERRYSPNVPAIVEPSAIIKNNMKISVSMRRERSKTI